MSGRFDFKGYAARQNDKSPRKLYNKSEKQPPAYKVTSSNSLIYDSSEFPSLSESSIKTLNAPDSEVKTLKYSDKLKQFPPNQNFFHQSVPLKENQVKNFNSFSKNNSSTSHLKNNSSKATVVDSKKSSISSVQNTSNQIPKYSLTHPRYAKQAIAPVDCKNQPARQINSANIFLAASSSHSASRQTSGSNLGSSNSGTESQSNKEIKCKLIFDKCKPKNEEETAEGKTKKKKKRKSKVKRQAALQTGKITVLTPEIHSKILNQSSAVNSSNFKSVLTDINDEEEYPELGKSFVFASQKENVKKESIAVGLREEKQVSDDFAIEQPLVNKEHSNIPDKKTVEKKGKAENKTVHPNDPITVTFFDILMTRNSKVKEKDLKEEISPTSITGLLKVKPKKGATHAPNLLDSSKPAVKRGKERENPKPKKPSHLKKIILLDRKHRREQLLQVRGSTNQKEIDGLTGNECQEDDDIQKMNDSDSETDVENNFSKNTFDECNLEMPTDIHIDKSDEENVPLLESSCDLFSVSPDTDLMVTENSIDKKFMNLSICDESETPCKQEQDILSEVPVKPLLAEKHLNVLESNDSLLKSLSGAAKTIEVSEKEKAAKILLHTRNFREYCNHLISKDIDNAVHALLDDLARFQDRMHQKDPVKARMKRRMIYGVKEVKKHIKLRKLKCIIIATDIENVETEGGLNDILNDIKSLAADHNIPCVFALCRKVLGKVCHKPVPVSCIGVFNPEGSEVNFKKIVELLIQSQKDYTEMLNKLTVTISDEEAVTLFKAKKEAPETLHEIRTNMLREIFLPSKYDDTEVGNASTETTDISDSPKELD